MNSLNVVVVIGCVVDVVAIVDDVAPDRTDEEVEATVVVVVRKLRSGTSFGDGIGRNPRNTSNIG
jgi:hypothetical protein